MAGINTKIGGISKHIHTPYENIISKSGGGIRPGIYRNESQGLISLSSDLENWITIEDKNHGAKRAWAYGEPRDYESRGYHYQRGNDYGFDNTIWSYIDDRTSETIPEVTFPYSSATWITTNQRASNLYKLKRTGKNIKPGYHIPDKQEYTAIMDMFKLRGILSKDNTQKYLKLPFTGYRDASSYFNYNTIRSAIWLRTADHTGSTSQYSGGTSFYGDGFYNSRACHGNQIRLAKNDIVIPDSTRTILYSHN